MHKSLWLVVSGMMMAGCAYYSMAGSIPPNIRSLAIPLVMNQTSEFGITEQITDDLQSRFQEENILRLKPEQEADSILRGTLLSVEDVVHTFTKEEAVSEYRLTLKIEFIWYDVKKDKVLLSKVYTGWGAYGFGSDISTDGVDNDGDGLIDSDDEDEFGEPRAFATRIAVTKIAEDVINDFVTSW